MDALLDTIRVAMADGASDDERRRGLAACHTVAEALAVALPAQPLTPPAVADAPAPVGLAAPPTDLRVALTGPNPFAGLTADQILELAVAKLRGAVGEDVAPAPAGQPFRLTLVPVPRAR